MRRAPGRRKPIEESALHESLREGRDDLFAPTDGAGFVHTPSLNHATAAAVLRNGYLTHATPTEPGRLAVNLSSRRVRRAKELMDGVRNGQPIEVLLGIEFERGLHDATTRPVGAVVLNDLKPAFRQAFPIKRTRIPKAGHPGRRARRSFRTSASSTASTSSPRRDVPGRRARTAGAVGRQERRS